MHFSFGALLSGEGEEGVVSVFQVEGSDRTLQSKSVYMNGLEGSHVAPSCTHSCVCVLRTRFP